MYVLAFTNDKILSSSNGKANSITHTVRSFYAVNHRGSYFLAEFYTNMGGVHDY